MRFVFQLCAIQLIVNHCFCVKHVSHWHPLTLLPLVPRKPRFEQRSSHEEITLQPSDIATGKTKRPHLPGAHSVKGTPDRTRRPLVGFPKLGMWTSVSPRKFHRQTKQTGLKLFDFINLPERMRKNDLQKQIPRIERKFTLPPILLTLVDSETDSEASAEIAKNTLVYPTGDESVSNFIGLDRYPPPLRAPGPAHAIPGARDLRKPEPSIHAFPVGPPTQGGSNPQNSFPGPEQGRIPVPFNHGQQPSGTPQGMPWPGHRPDTFPPGHPGKSFTNQFVSVAESKRGKLMVYFSQSRRISRSISRLEQPLVRSNG